MNETSTHIERIATAPTSTLVAGVALLLSVCTTGVFGSVIVVMLLEHSDPSTVMWIFSIGVLGFGIVPLATMAGVYLWALLPELADRRARS